LKVDHFARGSVGVGNLVNRLRSRSTRPSRWRPGAAKSRSDLVQIRS
jgi:hypothetical protein